MLKLLSLIACLLVGFLAAGQAQDAPKQEVTLAILAPSALVWVHAVAVKQGFYAARGITVRELRAGDSPALLQAVSSGSTNAGLSLGDLAIRAIDRGAPIVIAGAALDKSILRLFSAKAVSDLKSLDGASVTAGAVRGGTADLLRYQVLQGGGAAASLKMVSIANSRDRIVALGNGQINAALLIAPFDTLAERDGFRFLDVYRAPYVETPLILNRNWAAANHAAATGLVHGMRDAAAWMNRPENRGGAVEILAEYTNTPKDVCERSYDFIITDQHAIPPTLEVTGPGLENIAKIDVAVNGGAAGVFDLAKYYDSSFLAAR